MKKFLLSILTIFCVIATANAETYTHIFKNGELTTTSGTVALNDVEWSASSVNEIGWSNTKGIQFGSKNNPNPSYTLSTSDFASYKITSVTVNSSIAASGDAKLTITVGSQTSEAYKLTTSNAAYTFDCDDTDGVGLPPFPTSYLTAAPSGPRPPCSPQPAAPGMDLEGYVG